MEEAQRIQKVLQYLEEMDAKAFISDHPVDVRYFTGAPDPRGCLILRRDGSHHLIISASAAREAQDIVDTALVTPVVLDDDVLQMVVARLPEDGVIVHGRLSEKILENLKNRWSVVDGVLLIQRLQRLKTSAEINTIFYAVAIAEQAIAAGYPILKVGMTELEIAAEITRTIMRLGAENMWFPVHVVSGTRSVYPDAGPARRPLCRGDMVFIDVGPLFEGYAGDLTRSFVIGPLTPKQQTILEMTQHAQELAVSRIKCGVKTSELYHLIYDYFAKNDVSSFFPHPLGHGLGLLGACPPYFTPGSSDILEEGDIITIEPGLYVPGLGGCRIEDIFKVTKHGAEHVSTLSLPWEVT